VVFRRRPWSVWTVLVIFGVRITNTNGRFIVLGGIEE
jgi:hypothetical protein